MRILSIFSMYALWVLIPICAAQTKTLKIDRPLDDDPVRILKITEGNTEIKSDGTPLPGGKSWWQGVIPNGGDDWLAGLSLTIKNVSTKKIVYLGLSCNVSETADWAMESATHSVVLNKSPEPLLGQLNNRIGLRPEAALYSFSMGTKSKPDSGPAFELAPGQTYTIAFESPDYYPGLKSSIAERKGSISAANACNGGISHVFFDDGTQWQGHRYMRADPDTRGRWITIKPQEWSGAKPEVNQRQPVSPRS
jgi:hypothetical protein